jgi:hypothetical protein
LSRENRKSRRKSPPRTLYKAFSPLLDESKVTLLESGQIATEKLKPFPIQSPSPFGKTYDWCKFDGRISRGGIEGLRIPACWYLIVISEMRCFPFQPAQSRIIHDILRASGPFRARSQLSGNSSVDAKPGSVQISSHAYRRSCAGSRS